MRYGTIMKRSAIGTLVLILVAGVLVVRSHAWWSGGHKLCTLAAASKLPEEMPKFFRDAGKELAEMSTEPDNWKNVTVSHLRTTEQPEHFIDLEYLGEEAIPPQRYDLLAHFSESQLTDANIPARHWGKYTGASVMTVTRGNLRDGTAG